MIKKTLLLNSNYEVLSFITDRKAFKLIFKDKVDILSSWDEKIKCGSINLDYPATIKLKNLIKRNYYFIHFSRHAIVKRDNQTCQYCFKKLTAGEVTIDHVVPKSKGGNSSFTNCVVSCNPCNNKKSDLTLEQSGLKLTVKPTHPSFDGKYYFSHPPKYWHQDWDLFLGR